MFVILKGHSRGDCQGSMEPPDIIADNMLVILKGHSSIHGTAPLAMTIVQETTCLEHVDIAAYLDLSKQFPALTFTTPVTMSIDMCYALAKFSHATRPEATAKGSRSLLHYLTSPHYTACGTTTRAWKSSSDGPRTPPPPIDEFMAQPPPAPTHHRGPTDNVTMPGITA
ncbi:unnamed protein product [Zymoseptoria tritici ST99CH_1A5]|uniref:Uncharacterized protein n=1 Tax=Zymoseptoria tritici ST99CH_1A5 TaxID=1276529 RepID=A0A1Y6M348_ZYMTR|nr:unnamed protein product [Zymoseptoria tritici ST99CH_1A5]